MIFYFTGTGNSRLVANQIAEILQDETVCINQCIKEGITKKYTSQKPYVFVAPTYGWQLPRLVESFILNTTFEGATSAYFILTCGGSIGNAEKYAKRLCIKKNFEFCGVGEIVMPENYLALFPTPSKEECASIIQHAMPQIDFIANKINSKEVIPSKNINFKDKLNSGLVNSLFYTFIIKDKPFKATQSCTGCGKCAKLCPLNNIKIEEGKPVWLGGCTHCMACICGCPSLSVEYGEKSVGRYRHFLG